MAERGGIGKIANHPAVRRTAEIVASSARRLGEVAIEQHDAVVDGLDQYLDKPGVDLGAVKLTRRQALVGTTAALGEVALAGYVLGNLKTTQGSVPAQPNEIPTPAPRVVAAPRPIDSPVPIHVEASPSPMPTLGESEAAKNRREQLVQTLIKEFPRMRSQEHLEASTLPFMDDDANEVAKELGITHAGEFFDVPTRVIPKLIAWLHDDAFRIYLPKVYEHDAVLAGKAKEHGVSENLLKILATQESGGNAEAGEEDGSGGQGLMQVEEIHFHHNESRDQKIEPEFNIETAITEVVKDYEKRVDAKSFPWQKPVAEAHKGTEAYKWLRIAQAYNGGEKAINAMSAYDDSVSPIAKLYFDHVLRFALISQIAAGLKKRGFDEAEVAAKLTSYEVQVRSEVLEKALKEHPVKDFSPNATPQQREEANKTYRLYRQMIEILGKERIDPAEASQMSVVGGKTMEQSYRESLQKTNYGKTGDIQLNPALRIWLSHDPSHGLWIGFNDDLYDWQEAYAGPAHGDIKSWRATQPAQPPQAVPPVEVSPIVSPSESAPVSGEKVIVPDEYRYSEQNVDFWEDKADYDSTCGPTSVAMVLSTLLGRIITPTEVNEKFLKEPLGPPFYVVRRTGGDTVFCDEKTPGKENGVVKIIRRDYRLKVDQMYDAQGDVGKNKGSLSKEHLQRWKDALDAGALIVASSGHARFIKRDENGKNLNPNHPWSQNGTDHIFVIEDVDVKNGTMTIIDSWDGKRKKNISISDIEPPAYAYAVKKAA